jgi:hypothetical protein
VFFFPPGSRFCELPSFIYFVLFDNRTCVWRGSGEICGAIMPSPGLCRPPFLPAASFESALWLQASSSHFGVPCCRSSASTSTLSGFLVTGVNKSCRRSSRKGNRCKDLRARAWVCQSPLSPSPPEHLVLVCRTCLCLEGLEI